MNSTKFSRGVDFHCHLDLYPDYVDALAAVEKAGIYTLSVTTTPKAWPRNRDLVQGKRFIRSALGLHPQLIAERAHELKEWERYLPEARYIGEVGLDAGPRFYKSFDTQKKVFQTILESCAAAGGKILSVHSVRSASVILGMIEKHFSPERGKIVLHWFTGNNAEVKQAVELGCYFSINTEMARSERGRILIKMLPSNRLLTETDGPFIQIKDRPAYPTDVPLAVEAIASIRNVPTTNMNDIVHTNLISLLRSVSSEI